MKMAPVGVLSSKKRRTRDHVGLPNIAAYACQDVHARRGALHTLFAPPPPLPPTRVAVTHTWLLKLDASSVVYQKRPFPRGKPKLWVIRTWPARGHLDPGQDILWGQQFGEGFGELFVPLVKREGCLTPLFLSLHIQERTTTSLHPGGTEHPTCLPFTSSTIKSVR